MNQSEVIRSNGMPWKLPDISPSKLGTWLTCPMKFYYNYIRRIPRKSKIFFPQGTVVHYAVELLHNDLAAGKTLDKEYYLMKMEECWLDEVERERGEIYDNKGNLLNEKNLKFHFKETERWFDVYFEAVENNTIPNFDPASVKETEIDLLREVVHHTEGPLGVNIRGKIDWVIDLDSDVAKLADLKTASTHWMGRWSKIKADAQLQATCYGYLTGKDCDFSYVIVPKVSEKDRAKAAIEHYQTKRTSKDYIALEDIVLNFVKQTDVLNNYKDFVPYCNPSPTMYSHCNRLCDFTELCYEENYK